jgi:CBS domain containing-hemolysin-like protein
VEEIVGEIRDEYDIEENLYEQVSPDEYIVDAKMSISEFDDLLDTELENEDYDTLGGFLYAQLDKIPVAGDTLTYGDFTFTVLATRGRRITKVRVERVRKQEQQQSQPLRLLPNPSSNENARQNDSGNERSHIEYRGA